MQDKEVNKALLEALDTDAEKLAETMIKLFKESRSRENALDNVLVKKGIGILVEENSNGYLIAEWIGFVTGFTAGHIAAESREKADQVA